MSPTARIALVVGAVVGALIGYGFVSRLYVVAVPYRAGYVFIALPNAHLIRFGLGIVGAFLLATAPRDPIVTALGGFLLMAFTAAYIAYPGLDWARQQEQETFENVRPQMRPQGYDPFIGRQQGVAPNGGVSAADPRHPPPR